jgi:hypothetical protein
MTSQAVEFIWSRSGSDEAFLADIKAAMATTGIVKTPLRVIFDPPASYIEKCSTIQDDSSLPCLPWMTYLSSVAKENEVEFDVVDGT